MGEGKVQRKIRQGKNLPTGANDGDKPCKFYFFIWMVLPNDLTDRVWQ